MVRLQEVMPVAVGLTISGLAGAGGVGVETIRYYQRRGLLAEPQRPHGSGMAGGIRRYGAEDVRRLRFIRSAQAAGFTLSEIAELLALDAGQDRQRARELAEMRIGAIDAEIAKLQPAREGLRRMSGACASTQDGPCPILTAFDG